MKHDPAQVKKLNSLMKKLKARHKDLEPPGYTPTTQLIIAFLTADATRKQAEKAYDALMEHMVDNNELRVSHTEEIVEIIGEKYPRVYWRVERMREALNEIFRREHDHNMVRAAQMNKKEQRQYLDSLPGMIPYVSASVMLLCFGGHAIPVDDKLNALLVREGIVDEGLTPAEVEALLLRQFKAGDPAVEAHLLLQAWSDGCRTPAHVLNAPEPATFEVESVLEKSPEDEEQTPPAKTTKKKTTKKKTTKKKTTKKTTAAKRSKKK